MGGGFNYGDDFVGRYGAQKVKLIGVGVSGSLAYAVNDRLSLGAGLSVVYTQFEQRLALNQGALPDAKIHFTGGPWICLQGAKDLEVRDGRGGLLRCQR